MDPVIRVRFSNDAEAKLWRALAWAGALALIALAFACGKQLGLTWDEPLQLRYGNRILAWYRSGFSDRSALTYAGPIYEYGGLFEAPAQFIAWFMPFEPTATRHVLTSLTAAAGIAAAWKLAARIAGPRAGFVAALLLALTPAWWGHGLFNSKDIPFGTAAAWALYATLGLMLGPRPVPWRSVVWAGLATGAALGIRAGGLFLFAYPVLGLAACWIFERRARVSDPPQRERAWLGVALRGLAFVSLAWVVMLICWPWAQLDPLRRPFEAIHHATQVGWGGEMLFRGEIIRAQTLPVEYLPTWFAVTLPETYLVAGLCALALGVSWLVRRFASSTTAEHTGGEPELVQKRLALAMIAFAAFGPVVAAVVLRTALYDGQRHFLFVLPPLAALSGVAVSSWLHTQRARLAYRALGGAALLATCALTAREMAALHPYEYVYFNRFAGGLAGASQRFETDYWGASYQEGLAWVVENVHPARGTRLRVSSCTCFYETRRYIQDVAHASSQFEVVKDGNSADIFLVGAQRSCGNHPGRVVHVVKRDGVRLLEVLRRDREPS